MKTKKKKTNTYKFQSFAQRINNINIDVFTQTGDKFHGIPDDEKDTFFRETLEKLSEMNCSLDFISLYREVKPYVRTFNMLVYHREKIVSLLKKYLSLEGSFATKACLELLSAFARDLSQDFYQIFEELFDVLVQLLKRKDAEVVEDTFVCLAYIFKCTWRYMVHEIDNIFRNFKSLLSDTQTHVQSFTAELFAFLIQKSKKRKSVIEGILSEASKDPRIAAGVGCLIFQTIKGIKYQFILSANEVLRSALNVFSMPEIDNEQVLIALKSTWLSSLRHTKPEYCGLLFTSIYESLEELSQENTDSVVSLSCYYELLNVAVSFKNGYFIEDQLKLFQVLGTQFAGINHSAENITSLIDLLKSCIEVSNLKISDAEVTRLFMKFLNYKKISVTKKLDFIRGMFSWGKFEEDLMDGTLDYVSKCLLGNQISGVCEVKNTVFDFIVDLIYRERRLDEPFSVFIDESSLIWLPVSSDDQIVIENMILEDMKVELWESNVQKLWTLVTCISYFRLTDVDRVVQRLSDILKYALELPCEKLKEDTLCTLAYCVKAVLIIEKRCERILDVINWEQMISLVRMFPINDHVLQAFEAYCCCVGNELKILMKGHSNNLHELLKMNINGPHKLLSLLTLKIISHLDDYSNDTDSNQGVIQHCIDALDIEVLLNTYQERLVIMRMVTWNSQMNVLQQDVALRSLVGNLYINFSVMWEPIYQMIATHAHSGNDLFWKIWVEILSKAADICVLNDSTCKEEVLSTGTYSKCFTSISTMKDEMRVDYRNFRALLWNTMGKFPELVEKNAKDIVPLYLRFMSDEYSLIDEMIAKKQDISVKDEKLIVRRSQKVSGKGKTEFQALCAHLRVLSLFRKPKKLEKEFQLHQWYLDFLTSKDNEIQCLALKCLMTYNHPYMTPYKENFDKLMDDTKFRDELMFFSSAPEETDGVIVKEHLKLLMPVLIRLLYGKLQRRSGLGASGKSGSSARRNIIMQFIINSSNEEIKTFFDLILEPFKTLQDISFTNSVIDVTAVVPLRKQTGFLNMFTTILTKLGKKAEVYLPQMFDTLLKILWTCSEIIRLKDQVHASYLPRVKDIRRLGLAQLNSLFEKQEENFNYREKVDDICIAGVWPQLPDLVTESCQCPTPLLKLFVTWSKYKDYQFLLSIADKNGLSPISCLFQLLKQKSLSGTVENLIMNIVWNTIEKEDVDKRSVEELDKLLIKPYIDDLLKHISTNLFKKTKDKKKKQMMKNVIPNIQFLVLSKLSELVSDTEQSSVLVGILFPLLQCIGSEATQTHIVTTIKNLLPYVENTSPYINNVPPLFSMVQTRNPRQVLCDVYVTMTKENDKLELIGDLVHRMNAWDSQRLDEPDYDKRLGAFRIINTELRSNKWNCEQILPILHNSLYFLLTTEDLSLRNAASSCIENIIHAVELNNELFTDIIHRSLFPFVKNGLKSKREEVRVEFISLLGILVKTFSDHNQFTDMAHLCSENPETDFFKNFNHLQVHRKIRAIHQLAALCDEGKLSVSNMFFIMIPMVTPILFTKLAASKDHNLLSETISAVGSIMKQMPWSKYSHVLKNYLKILQQDIKNQKNVLRLLMAVLNNFHFDLSPLDTKGDCSLNNLDAQSEKISNGKEIEEKNVATDRIDQLDNGNKSIEISATKSSGKEVLEDLECEATEEVQLKDVNDELAQDGGCIMNSECLEINEDGYGRMCEEAVSKELKSKDKSEIDGEDKELTLMTDSKKVDNNEENPEGSGCEEIVQDEQIKSNDNFSEVISNKEMQMEEEVNCHTGTEMDTVLDEVECDEESNTSQGNENTKDEEIEMDDDDVEPDEEMDINEMPGEGNGGQELSSNVDTLKRIYAALADYIIPRLNRFLQKKSLYDSSKSNYKEVDDQAILKLPMELALSQLLHKLPGGILNVHIPGVLLRVSQNLRSHSKDVREMARDTLKKISFSLGAPYMSLTLKEMKSILQHGYQRHVLGYTLHSVLDNMTEILKTGDLDSCVQGIMEVVVDELVGIVGEEKEVSAITNKLFEAQHRKSNSLSELTAKFVSNEHIGNVIGPLKEVLDSSQVHTVIHKIEEALFHIANGLQNNSGLMDGDILIFIHGVLSNAMSSSNSEGSSDHAFGTIDQGRQDCYLVADKPVRGGFVPKTSDKTNNHILITFGLHLFNSCLKRQRFNVSDANHIKMLDPIIPIIMTNIHSKYNKIVTLSLKCLCALFKFQLPCTKSYFPTLGKILFKTMKTYTQAGASKGKDVELVANSFKAMTILMRDHKDFNVTEKQLKILLSLVEEDIHISSRQVVALPLLKAILSRKVKISLLSDIIQKISDLSIRDSEASVQLQCRKIVLQYMLDYPLGKKIVDHFDFYIAHLSYEEDIGRLSALEMITLIVNNIPQGLLLAYAGYMFIPLVMMLVNDDSANCRKLCGCTIKVLIQMLDTKTRDEMFDLVINFYSNNNVSLHHVSIQLMGLFAEVEKKNFSRHVNVVFPLFEEMLKSYAKMKNTEEDSRLNDKALYSSINCLVKIFNEMELMSSRGSHIEQIGRMCGLCIGHLLHPHAWIRLSVSQLFSLHFGLFTPEEWLKSSDSFDENGQKVEPADNVKDLCFSFLSQLKDNNLNKEIGEQATKNLVFLFRVVKVLDPLTNCNNADVNEKEDAEENELVSSEEKGKSISVSLFLRKLRQIAAYEAANNPKETKKRTCVLRLIASLSLCLGEEFLMQYLVDILPTIHREIGPSAIEGSAVNTLAQEVLELIQNVVKKDEFANAYSKIQKNHLDRKDAKKRKLATEAITNPAHIALRKQKKNLTKREQRKRKLIEKKPSLKYKKIRSSIDNNS